MNDDPHIEVIDLEPGSIVVVGPKGRLHLHTRDSGRKYWDAQNCDFIGTSHMTDAHRAIVEERWDKRTIDGGPIGEYAELVVPNSLVKPLTADTRDFMRIRGASKRPWWKFLWRGK